MNKTLYRQWLILRALKRFPGKTGVAEIESMLSDLRIEVTRRTIERDLIDLEDHPFFPIGHDDNKPRGWYWRAEAAIMDIPAMEPSTALTFSIVEQFTRRLLPRSICDKLGLYQARAKEVLKALPESKFTKWAAKVRYVPRGQVLVPAQVEPEVLAQVYDALLYDKKLKVAYQAAHREKPVEIVVNPLGLVIREPIIYLVAVAEGHPDPYVYVLHRTRRAEVVNWLGSIPKGFNLDEYVNSGALGVRVSEKPIKLKLRLHSNGAEKFLAETPLSADQTLCADGRGGRLLTATVPDTLVLRSFLLGMEDSVEVISPATLRKEIGHAAARTAGLY